MEAQMFPSGRRVVHRFQSGEEEYIETTGHTLLTPAAKKQGGHTQLDTIIWKREIYQTSFNLANIFDMSRVETYSLYKSS